MIEIAACTLRHDLTRILVECAGLRNSFHSLLHLGIRFQLNFEPFLHAEIRDQHFLLDLALYPIQVLGHIRLGVVHVVLSEIFVEALHHVIVHFKLFRDCRLVSHVIAREASHATFVRIENVGPEEILLEVI